METEIWKDIPGYEWRYKVSSLWNIFNNISGKSIKKCLYWTWYYVVTLYSWSRKNRKQYKVHRLVAQAHINNTFWLPYINHIDCIKTNNSISNLEWCTAKQNTLHAWKNGRMTKNYLSQEVHPMSWKYGKNNPKSIQVLQYSKNWILIHIWWSIIDIERITWISSANICSHLKWRLKTAWWYIFKKL